MSSARTRGTGAGAGRSGAAAVDAKVQRRTCDARRDDRPMDATPFFIPLSRNISFFARSERIGCCIKKITNMRNQQPMRP